MKLVVTVLASVTQQFNRTAQLSTYFTQFTRKEYGIVCSPTPGARVSVFMFTNIRGPHVGLHVHQFREELSSIN